MNDVFVPEAGLDQEYKKLSAALDIRKKLKQPGVVAYLKGPDNFDIPLPESVFNVLVKVVDAMQTGQGVSVVPMAAKLTTQQAADFLGVSRPTFIKLASTYEVALELIGKHRRITLQDLLKMQAQMQSQRDAALDELIDHNSSEGLYQHDRSLLPNSQ
jgi:excisionase family DNA binding protein